MRYHQGGIIKPAVLQKVTAQIVAGSSISSLTKTSSPNYLVKFSTLARCRRENPEFGRLVADATKDSNRRGSYVDGARSRTMSLENRTTTITEFVP
jgi:hypothetical protein